MSQELAAGPEAAGERLDLFLASRTPLSRSRAKALIDQGKVLVNGRPKTAKYPVAQSDQISVQLPSGPASQVPAAAPKLPVVYEDDDVLIIDKPAGLVVHPGAGTPLGQATVADFARLNSTDTDTDRPGIVHRLDRDTSGLMMIARTGEAKHYLQRALAQRLIHKTYLALVVGRLNPSEATIDLPLGRDPRHRLRQAVVPTGRPSLTVYTTRATYPGFTLVQARPLTGRTHQLRVHFAATGHPIAGDSTYGQSSDAPGGLSRQFLHATRLELTGPHGQAIVANSPLPDDLRQCLDQLEHDI